MAYSFDNNTPIYLQLLDLFRRRIVTGEFEPGGRLPTVRDIAVEYGVNPNTVQRALTELEREGLAFSRRTSGRFITEDEALIETVRKHLARSIVESFIVDMHHFGYNEEKTHVLIKEFWRGDDGSY